MSEKSGQAALPVIGAVLGLFGTVVGIWGQISSQLQQEAITELKSTLDVNRDVRESRGAERDYLMKVTDKVLQAIDSPNIQRQKVAALMIDTLGDVEIQKRLRSVLLDAGVPELKPALSRTIADEAAFAEVAVADQAAQSKGEAVAVAALPGIEVKGKPSSGKMSVDIFYCEGASGAAHKAMAQSLFNEAGKGEVFGRLRLRPLAESVNRRPGFGLVSNEIRYQSGEENAANALQNLAPGNFGMTVRQVRYDTPNYISAFICSGSR